MSVYLHDIPLIEAQGHLHQALAQARLGGIHTTERLPLGPNLLGRVLAEPVWALNSSPHYHASAMDGFAVRANETSLAMPTAPVLLQIGIQAAYVDTGDALPGWANAVIPIENVEPLDKDLAIAPNPRAPFAIRIRAAVVPWSHVRPLGEDIVATQLVLHSGHAIGPYDLGAIAASGHVEVTVSKKPRVAILPTGTELVPLGSVLNPGDILEYNSLVISAQVQQMGAEPTVYPITPDDFAQICDRVRKAARECDLVLLNAGSSAGSEDFSARVVQELGTLLVHGVAVRPGHPVIIGMIKTGIPEKPNVPIIGLPGYPVSAALTVDIFVEPLLAKWLGRQPLELETISAALTRKTVSPPGDDDFVRVVVGRVEDKILCAPIARGAGVISSLVKADGLLVIPRGVQGIEAGDNVKVRIFRNKSEIDKTIFCIGSHDVILDLIAQFLSAKDRRFVSSNVGSQGGLVALRRGEAHLAGTHLLDPETGDYNTRYLNEYLPGIDTELISLVHREQGLIVAKDNPLGIKGLNDLTRNDVSFINRQRGAGTRVLLDYHLSQLGIAKDKVQGYVDEEYTHLGVAAAILGGRATCGLGIPSAATALGLDFIPLFHERYDLAIPAKFASGDLLAPLFDLFSDVEFRKAVLSMPGYDVGCMGQRVEL